MRVRWIDIAKGIGILLVCAGHSRIGNEGPVGSWLGSFHMPLFFVMAGLCYDEDRYATYWDYIKRKGVALCYPYFMLSIAVALIYLIFGFGETIDAVKGIFYGFPGLTIGGFWFIRTLILVELLYAALFRTTDKFRPIVVAFLGLIGFAGPRDPSPVRINVVLISLLYVELGWQCRRFPMRDFSVWKLLSFVGVVGFCHFLMLVCTGYPHISYGGAEYAILPIVAILLAAMGTSIVSAASWLLDRVPFAGECFGWLGRHSILLLAVHPACGRLRRIWISQFPGLAGWESAVLELGLIVFLMWALSGPLCFFWKMPRMKKRAQ